MHLVGIRRRTDVHRIKTWSRPSRCGKRPHGRGIRARRRGGKIHGRTMTLAGWSGAAYGDPSTMGKWCLGYVTGLMSSASREPRHFFQRRLVTSSLGGDVSAFSGMVDHMPMLREFHAHFLDVLLSLVGLDDCESLSTHLKNGKNSTEKPLVRHFGHPAGLGDAGTGQCLLASWIGKSGGWIDENQWRYGAPPFVFWNLGRRILARYVP